MNIFAQGYKAMALSSNPGYLQWVMDTVVRLCSAGGDLAEGRDGRLAAASQALHSSFSCYQVSGNRSRETVGSRSQFFPVGTVQQPTVRCRLVRLPLGPCCGGTQPASCSEMNHHPLKPTTP